MTKEIDVPFTLRELKVFERVLMAFIEDAYTNKEIEDPEFSYYLGFLVDKIRKYIDAFEQKNEQTG